MRRLLKHHDEVRMQMNGVAKDTVGDHLRGLMNRFKVAGIETAKLDARLLTAEIVGCAPGDLIWREKDRLVGPQVEKLQVYAKRRLRREPVAYILERRAFWKDEFLVSPETLVPRPDSETLVLSVLERVPSADANVKLLDLGTGSGCLLLSLLRELPKATGVGVDLNPGAIEIARKNAERLGVHDRAKFRVSDWFSKVTGSFDIVIANPPYIVDKHIQELDPDVREFEPCLALAGGGDGLKAYREIAASLKSVLGTRGFAAMEIGADQAKEVRKIYEAVGFHIDDVVRDLGDRDRCILMH